MLVLSAAVSGLLAFHAGASGVATGRSQRAAAVTMAADGGELAMLQAMSDSFWKQKRARLQAELAAQLLELDEFEARERALQQVAAGVAGAGAVGGAGVAELQAALEAERARSAALEEELAAQKLEAELNVQKVSAFWIEKLNAAKSGGALPPADAAPALAKAAVADFVDDGKPFLEEDLSLRELRARLLSYGLSTAGLKSELRDRLMYAVAHERLQHQSWDAASLSWK